MGNCVLGVLLCHAHFLSVIFTSADRCVNCAGRGLYATACEYSFILSCKAMLFYLSRKKVMCAVGLGNDQQTACIFVYPMDYPRANDAVY